jgi:hypothetical protein
MTNMTAGEISTQDAGRYRGAWHSYVARRNLVVVLFIGLVPLGFLIARLRLSEIVSMAVLAGWIAVYLAGAWWLTKWACPRCGKAFANRLWTARCISCGLSKDDVAAAARGK